MILVTGGGLILILLKLLLRISDINHHLFLLVPVSFIVEVFCNDPSQFIPRQGFLFPGPGIIINQSCSGSTFMLTALLPAGYLLLKYSRSRNIFFGHLPLALLLVYALTILANATRILTALKLKSTSFFTGYIMPENLHELQGMATYLFYLITAFLLTEKWLQLKSRTYAHVA